MSRFTKALVLMAVAALGLAGCGEGAATPDENGEIVITMTESAYAPDTIEVSPGQTVTFVLVNEGEKDHELMIGRNVTFTDGVPDGFEHNFFEGLSPLVDPPEAAMEMDEMDMDMDMDMDEDDDMHMEDMDMDEDDDMDMEDMDMEDMDMDEDDDMHMEDMDMDEDDDMHMEDMDMEEGDDHAGHGFMVLRQPNETARITITIPLDATGEWELGCFEEDGAHWDDGMKGTFTIVIDA